MLGGITVPVDSGKHARSMLSMLDFLSLSQVPAPQPSPLQNNAPLVDSGARNIIYLGLFLLTIAATVVIGIISKKLEYALIFAAALSAVLIAFFWFL